LFILKLFLSFRPHEAFTFFTSRINALYFGAVEQIFRGKQFLSVFLVSDFSRSGQKIVILKKRLKNVLTLAGKVSN